MPVPEGIWATIESQIPVKKEKPKFWFLFLLLAFAIPYVMLSTQTKSESIAMQDKARQAEHFTDNNTDHYTNNRQDHINYNNNTENKKQIDHTKPNTKEQAKEWTLTSPTSESSVSYSNSKLFNSENKRPVSSEASLSKLNVSSVSTNLSNDFSNLDFVSSNITSNKKLKFFKNPTASNKQSKSGVFKLIEKSRTYKAAVQTKQLTTLSNQYYKGGICYNNENVESYFNAISDRRAALALCPSFDKTYSGFYVFSDLNFGFTHQTLTTQSADHQAQVALRSSKERNAFSISTNIGIGKKWHNGILLETGLNYDKININAEEYNNDKSHSRLVIKIDSVMTPNGWVTKIDSTYENFENEYSNLNSFTQINFPLAIGYEMPINEHFSLVAKTGVLFNITSSNKGTLVDDEGNSFIYNSNNPQTTLFRTNLGLSFLGNLSLQGEITPLLQAYAGINMNYYPSNFSLSSNPIQQTYAKIGLTTGLKYRL